MTEDRKMMRIIQFIFIHTIILFIFSCQGSSLDDKKLIYHTFNSVYEGKIGPYPVLLKLKVDSNSVNSGEYFYTEACNRLKILGGQIFDGDSIVFREVVERNPGVVTGTFTGMISADGKRINGKWFDEKKIHELSIEKTERDYENTYTKLCEEKIEVIDLLRQDGKNVLEKNERAVINVDYSRYNENIKAVIILFAIGNSGIDDINAKINDVIQKSGRIAGSLSVIDKRAKALEIILNEVDFNAFNKANGEQAFLNVFTVCDGLGEAWKGGRPISASPYYEDFYKPSGVFKREFTRNGLPENGFDLCIENQNNSWFSSSQDYQLSVLVYISSKRQLSKLRSVCDK